MPFGIGHWELIILAIVLVALFGSKQLPRVARQLGRGAREAGREYAEIKRSFDVPAAEPPVRASGPREGARGNREVPPVTAELLEPEAEPRR